MTKKSYNKDSAYKLFFGSLANLNRLKIINALRQGRKSVSEICQSIGFEQTMVSHNLKRLERCGMVFSEKKGKHNYYNVNKETIKPLLGLIDTHLKRYCIRIIKKKQKD